MYRELKIAICILLVCISVAKLEAQQLIITNQETKTSIRGLSVVDDKIAWVSGSNGMIGKSANGGKTWTWTQVKGFEKSDFRDIEAFSASCAIIMSSGAPALILKTNNGGESWEVVYRQNSEAWFLDEMTFVSKRHGYILGDPIDGKFVILETKNAGDSWQLASNLPIAMPGEAAFAASGTGIRKMPYSNHFYFVTGGKVARVFAYTQKFNPTKIPLAQGLASKGAFSVAAGGSKLVIVGGDYRQPNRRDSVACFYDGKLSKKSDWQVHLSYTQPMGFQSGVSYLGDNVFLSTGTSGTNISVDGGENWNLVDKNSFNVCEKAKHGHLILLAGDKGKIAIFKN